MSAPDELAEMKRYEYDGDNEHMEPELFGFVEMYACADADRVIAERDAEIALSHRLNEQAQLALAAALEMVASRDAEIAMTTESYGLLLDQLETARAEIARLREALSNAQAGIATYLADPLRKKSFAYAEIFIELLGERLTAALTPPSQAPDISPASHNPS